MPLVATLQPEIMDFLGRSLGYAPLEVGLIPEECVKALSVVDTNGLGYACSQTQMDPVTNGLHDLEEGHVMIGSVPRGMLLDNVLSTCCQNTVHSFLLAH